MILGQNTWSDTRGLYSLGHRQSLHLLLSSEVVFRESVFQLTDGGAGYPVGEGDPPLPLVVRVRRQPRVHVLQVRLHSGRLLLRHVHDALICWHIPENTEVKFKVEIGYGNTRWGW